MKGKHFQLIWNKRWSIKEYPLSVLEIMGRNSLKLNETSEDRG
jgi:hypothetical protein